MNSCFASFQPSGLSRQQDKDIHMQESIPISKFKATCLRLLDNVNKTGQSIIVTRKGGAHCTGHTAASPAQTG
jgi:hypothetical protein